MAPPSGLLVIGGSIHYMIETINETKYLFEKKNNVIHIKTFNDSLSSNLKCDAYWTNQRTK